VSRTSPGKVLTVQVALSRSFSHVTELLHNSIANPSSPLFCRYDMVNVYNLTRPSQLTMNAVTSWTATNNMSCDLMPGHSDWLECHASVAVLEKALRATFFDFERSGRVRKQKGKRAVLIQIVCAGVIALAAVLAA
jgi:hypothetical protein